METAELKACSDEPLMKQRSYLQTEKKRAAASQASGQSELIRDTGQEQRNVSARQEGLDQSQRPARASSLDQGK